MKATGIVRRIDDLGRVVVPKEIRRTLRIREGDPLEIFTDKDGEIILKKYSPIGELSQFAQQYVDAMASVISETICVCDRDQVIAVAGPLKKEFYGKHIHKDLENALNDRINDVSKNGEKSFIKLIDEGENSHETQAVNTIICEGDAIGAVILVGENGSFGDNEKRMVSIAANFLGKQMEG